MKTFAIGIVGAGEIVRKVHLPVLKSIEGVTVAWLYDTSSQRARAVADAYGVPAIAAATPRELPRCDVVLLAVPVSARASYLRMFAERETAVLCEKPFASSVAEHRNFLDDYLPHRLGCGYMRRFYRSTCLMEHVLRHNWLGPLRAIRISEGGRSRGSGSAQSFLDDPKLAAARGVLMDLGTHSLDLALHLTAVERFAVERSQLSLDGDVDRHAQANVRLFPTASNVDESIDLDYQVSWLTQQTNRIELIFRSAVVWSGVAPGAAVFMGDPLRPRDAIELNAPVEGAVTFNQAFALEWREFLDGLERGEESRVSARKALPTTALVEGIRTMGIGRG